MGSLSVFYWLLLLIIGAAVIIPVAKILRRTGHSPWWSILYLVPFVGWIALWVFAFSRWPSEDGEQAKTF